MHIKAIDRLAEVHGRPLPSYDEDQLIRVHQVIGKAALIYEKVRNAIDYREDHLLRKNAILRILKRKLFIEKILFNQTLDKLALQIIQEMIRAGYLKNNTEPKNKIKKVQAVLQKYQLLTGRADLSQKEFLWLLEIQACEIEEVLVPADKSHMLVRFAYETLNHRIITNKGEIEDKEKELQVYLAAHRALRKSDNSMLAYALWNLYYPEWRNNSEEVILRVAQQFAALKKEINDQINHPWARQLTKIFKRWSIVYWTIEDIVEADPARAVAVFDDSEQLQRAINKALEIRYKAVKSRLRTGAIRSIVYVFFTKMVLAILIEFPLDLLLEGFVNYTSLTINIFFPPVLMMIVALSIRTPGRKNTEMVVKEIDAIIYHRAGQQKFTLRAPKTRSPITGFLLHVLYLAVLATMVFYLYKGLMLIGFNIASIIIFILFLSLVSFFGIRIRRPVQEITIEEGRDNIFTLLLDFVAIPFATVGRWMSVKFSKINIIAFIFDFIIEAPFKIFIEVLEDMFGFWREKKEEAYD